MPRSAKEVFGEVDAEQRSKFAALCVVVAFGDGRWEWVSVNDPEREAKLEHEMRAGGEPIGFLGLLTEPPIGQVWPASAYADTKEQSDEATKRLSLILDSMAKQFNLHLVKQVRSADRTN